MYLALLNLQIVAITQNQPMDESLMSLVRRMGKLYSIAVI